MSENELDLEAHRGFARVTLGLAGGDQGHIASGLEDMLASRRRRVENATGKTPDDYKYGVAESVRSGNIPNYIYVHYEGREYGPVRLTYGALDGDPSKSTVLINAKPANSENDMWIKLEFKDEDIKS